jgi:hypothetical protein
MKRFAFGMATVAAAGALSAAASGATMHPVLAAKLTGMGEHGVVNFQSNAGKGQLCWTFDVMTDGVTGASIRDSGGMVVAKLGSSFKPKSCAAVSAKALGLIEKSPASYKVWVDTKAHPGELRGTLFAGMAHM